MLSRYATVSGRVARCPVFNRTAQHFCFLSGIKLIAIPQNNASIVAQYFVPPTLALPVSGIFERATCGASKRCVACACEKHLQAAADSLLPQQPQDLLWFSKS